MAETDRPADPSAPPGAAPRGEAPPRRAFVKSYGCQMNVHDSERMADLLTRDGYAMTENGAEADLIVLNTCHIREKAAEKVYSELGRIRVLRDARRAEGHDTLVAVAGCVAQAEGGEILRRAPVVDLVVGSQSYQRLPELVRAARNGPVVETEFPADDKFAHLPRPAAKRVRLGGPSAFLTVQEGCDKFCAFCVVPFTRGAEVSRPVADVVAEAEALAEAGIREVMLLGQNVNAYHGAGADGAPVGLAELLARLARIEGIARLRYATSHPNDMDAALVAAHAENPKLMPYLHLPVQSGSDRILKAMNRRHTADTYRRWIERARMARPDLAISSDFIVGFPGETDADFRDTIRLVEDIGFASAYSFKYSARPGTKAAEAPDPVPEPVMAERLAELQALLHRQQTAFNHRPSG